MRKQAVWLAILLTGVAQAAAPPAEPNVKKWQDEKGVWHYGDARPASADAAGNSAAEAYQRGDYIKAFEEYMQWAKQGDPRAQTMIGQMYLRGQGVGQNARSAIEWFRKAAVQGNTDAQLQLGMLYATDPSVASSEKEALLWLRKAAEWGNAEAIYRLAGKFATGQGVVRDDGEAASNYRRAAEKGHAGAQFELGNFYASGRGVS
ncbi:MAG: putative repeat protein, partial [Proteobacteria bacterium]|nr:putative repeat protein [Pseudomonadota bacterium]